jgi:hypothetical protein
MVVVNDHPRNFPGAVAVLPQRNKLSFFSWLGVLVPRVVKAVNSHLERAKALHAIHLHRSWNEFPSHFAAGILSNAIGQCRFTKCQATLIVIKLHVFGEQ